LSGIIGPGLIVIALIAGPIFDKMPDKGVKLSDFGNTTNSKPVPFDPGAGFVSIKFFRFSYGITYSIMNRKKLNKLKIELDRLRKSPQKAITLKKLAESLGRIPVKRGKEPNWESNVFDHLPPISIPDHGGRDLTIGTRNSILNQLEDDLLAWDESLED